jgi:hypothetical protein
MDRLEPLRIALRRPAMRLVLTLAAATALGFAALHVWALLLHSSINEELAGVPRQRTPPPEVRAPDGFVPLVDAKLHAKLGDAAEVDYEWWSEPRPMDFATFRGWAVRFRYRSAGGRAPSCRGGTRVAIMTDTFVDSIVTEDDLREVAGDAADPFLGEPEPPGTERR